MFPKYGEIEQPMLDKLRRRGGKSTIDRIGTGKDEPYI